MDVDKAATTPNISSLLKSNEILQKRKNLKEKCEKIIETDLAEKRGEQAREILWRKGYYEVVSLAKKHWKSTKEEHQIDAETVLELKNFIKSGILHYKQLILKFEQKFESLNIRNIIDFSIIQQGIDKLDYINQENEKKELYTVNENHYALETIGIFLICIGDLHRYFIEFNFSDNDSSFYVVNTKLTAKFYQESFKLNPKKGSKPHNQLGTLYAGKNFEIDSIFHYCYSLLCPVPFELSENNVIRIFQNNSNFLEELEEMGGRFKMENFMAQLILVVDIFFFDKEVNDFNILCHSVLIDFRKYLDHYKRLDEIVKSDHNSFIYKFTAIFMVCLLKLRINNSAKVFSLNAFLVAFCSEIIDCCINRIDNFITIHKEENLKFCESYNKKFQEFDRKIKRARELHRDQYSKNNTFVKNKQKTPASSSNNSQDVIVEKSELHDTKISLLAKKSQEKEFSDGKHSASSSQHKSQNNLEAQDKKKNNRRRRKRRGGRNESEESESSEDDSEMSDRDEDDIFSDNSLDTNFSDESEEESDFSSDYESSNDEEQEQEVKKVQEQKKPIAEMNGNASDKQQTGSDNDDDFVIETETIVYNNNSNQILNNLIKLQQSHQIDLFQSDDEIMKNHNHNHRSDLSSNEDFIIEDEVILFQNGEKKEENLEKIMKMKYKKRYTKNDPNLIIQFELEYQDLMKGLKILFDWLRMNQEVLISCYKSNPEFIHKIMKLINFLNIDIFTRKIYFERSMITTPNVRQDLRHLFDNRHRIAVDEDIDFKKFLLFEEVQSYLEWDLNYKLKISEEEDAILRNFKIIDFGFYLCKMKKFDYNFCARSRIFIERSRRRRERRREGRGMGNRNGREDCGGRRRRNRDRDRNRNRNGGECSGRRIRTRNRDRNRNRNQDYDRDRQNGNRYYGDRDDREDGYKRERGHRHEHENHLPQENGIENYSDNNSDSRKSNNYRKGYLKNKKEFKELDRNKNASTTDKENNDNNIASENKNELMGKLWLRSEVKSLESKMKKPVNINLTPYLMLDSKSLTNYLYIVKNLVKTKKFVILIPTAVLSDLDELKKTSEGARNAIKWMEHQFKTGTRFLRSQRNSETLPLPLIKVPKKLDRESSIFMQIMQFCNYMVSSNNLSDDESNDIVTFLTGDSFDEKKRQLQSGSSNGNTVNFMGILETIPVKTEQISQFYGKYKKK